MSTTGRGVSPSGSTCRPGGCLAASWAWFRRLASPPSDDERAWIGEDVDFYRALRRLARQERRTVRLIRQPRVQPSCRRFDTWPLWRILVWTNPLFIALFRRWKTAWPGWYSDAVR